MQESSQISRRDCLCIPRSHYFNVKKKKEQLDMHICGTHLWKIISDKSPPGLTWQFVQSFLNTHSTAWFSVLKSLIFSEFVVKHSLFTALQKEIKMSNGVKSQLHEGQFTPPIQLIIAVVGSEFSIELLGRHIYVNIFPSLLRFCFF